MKINNIKILCRSCNVVHRCSPLSLLQLLDAEDWVNETLTSEMQSRDVLVVSSTRKMKHKYFQLSAARQESRCYENTLPATIWFWWEMALRFGNVCKQSPAALALLIFLPFIFPQNLLASPSRLLLFVITLAAHGLYRKSPELDRSTVVMAAPRWEAVTSVFTSNTKM